MPAAAKIGLIAGLVASLCAPARADEIVGVLQLEIQGVSETAAEKFESSIEEGLTGTGYRVAPRQRLRKMLEQSSYIDGCHFGACLTEVYRNTKGKLVLVARITSLGPSYSFVVSLIDTRTGLPASQVANVCEVCTLEEAIATATLAVIELVTKTPIDVAEPTEVVPPPVDLAAIERARNRRGKRAARRTALFFIGAAVVAGGAGAYFLVEDDHRIGYPVMAAGGALAVAGTTFLGVSGRV